MSKKSIILILLCWLVASVVPAQEPFRKELSIGASFGMGISYISFYPKVKENMGYLGSNFGLTARLITQKHVGLILEINYSQQGWKDQFDDPQYHYSRRINYLDIPFLSHFYFGGKRARFFLNAGPKIGWKLSDSEDENVIGLGTYPPPNAAERTMHRGKELEKSFAWGLCGGPGLEIRTGIGYFQLEARYYYGLGSIFNDQVGQDYTKSASQAAYVKVTYLLPIIK